MGKQAAKHVPGCLRWFDKTHGDANIADEDPRNQNIQRKIPISPSK